MMNAAKLSSQAVMKGARKIAESNKTRPEQVQRQEQRMLSYVENIMKTDEEQQINEPLY